VPESSACGSGAAAWARGGSARGFAGDSEVVQNLACRFWLGDRSQDLHAAMALRTCQRVCHEHARGNGARTRLHRRARGCDGLLVVAWKAPAEVLGNEAISVANKTQHSALFRGSRVSRLGALIKVCFFTTVVRSRSKSVMFRVPKESTPVAKKRDPSIMGEVSLCDGI